MSYSDNPTESDDSRFSFLEIDGVGESAQEPADKPAPSAPAPKAEAPARCTRCSVAAPLTAGVCAVCARIAASQAEQAANGGKSPAFTRFWGLVTKRTGLGSMSTDQCVLGALPKLRTLLAEVEAGTTAYGLVPGTTAELLKEELVRSLRGLMNRVPQARVDGRKFAPSAATAAPEQTLATVAAQMAPGIVYNSVTGPVLVPVEKAPKARVTADNLIAVESSLESSGRLTYWSATGALDVAKLTEAWAAEGLDANDLPEIPSAKVALSRACKAQSTKSVLLRQHSEGGWTLTDLAGKVDLTKTTEDATLDKVVEQNGVRVRLSEAAPGKPEQILLTPPGGKNASQEVKDAAAVLGNKIRAEFNEARNEVSATDVRGWLVTTVAKLSGVALRDKGGFYFVPKMGAEKLLKIKAALKAASASAHKVYAIPVMQGEETIEAAMDSLRDELAAIVKATEDELSNPEGMGARAAANRIEDLTAFSAKIKSYESLLGVTLGAETALASLRDRLGKVSVDGTAGRAAALEID